MVLLPLLVSACTTARTTATYVPLPSDDASVAELICSSDKTAGLDLHRPIYGHHDLPVDGLNHQHWQGDGHLYLHPNPPSAAVADAAAGEPMRQRSPMVQSLPMPAVAWCSRCRWAADAVQLPMVQLPMVQP